MFLIPKEIIEEHSFSTAYDELLNEYPRLADVKIALDWLLARDPLLGQNIKDNFYIYKTSPAGPTPSFRVVYKYDTSDNPERISLISISPIEQE